MGLVGGGYTGSRGWSPRNPRSGSCAEIRSGDVNPDAELRAAGVGVGEGKSPAQEALATAARQAFCPVRARPLGARQ